MMECNVISHAYVFIELFLWLFNSAYLRFPFLLMFTKPTSILRQVQYTSIEREEVVGLTMHWLFPTSALARLSDVNHVEVG
jgi:hypothetical protein